MESSDAGSPRKSAFDAWSSELGTARCVCVCACKAYTHRRSSETARGPVLARGVDLFQGRVSERLRRVLSRGSTQKTGSYSEWGHFCE